MQDITTVTDHYDNHLAPIYSWMVGDFEEACRAGETFLSEVGATPLTSGRAIDLGCGHGVYTVPLARRGFEVHALDASQRLLDELGDNTRVYEVNDRVIPTHGDLRTFDDRLDGRVAAILCMGDTLTHLPSLDDVQRLIGRAASKLEPEGLLCLSFRDYTAPPPLGPDRFIPVRSDENRVQTCFLEYTDGAVLVHDLVHTRRDGGWELAVSAYPKLRLSPGSVQSAAQGEGMSLIHSSTLKGMRFFAFRR